MVWSPMRAADHFLSELDSLARSAKTNVDASLAARLSSSFFRMVVPVIGNGPAEELFEYWMDSSGRSGKPDFPKLGYFAAFLTGEYDEPTMPLSREDFEEIRDTLNEAAEEIDMDTLTELMAELVSRGLLK